MSSIIKGKKRNTLCGLQLIKLSALYYWRVEQSNFFLFFTYIGGAPLHLPSWGLQHCNPRCVSVQCAGCSASSRPTHCFVGLRAGVHSWFVYSWTWGSVTYSCALRKARSAWCPLLPCACRTRCEHVRAYNYVASAARKVSSRVCSWAGVKQGILPMNRGIVFTSAFHCEVFAIIFILVHCKVCCAWFETPLLGNRSMPSSLFMRHCIVP